MAVYDGYVDSSFSGDIEVAYPAEEYGDYSDTTLISGFDKRWLGKYTTDNDLFLEITGMDVNGKIIFVIQQGTEFCADGLEGKANLAGSAKDRYSEAGGSCVIDFQLGDGFVEITEFGDCGHGARCGSFDGHYKKKK
jgi:hypothetical protein